jgi:hypothetical protein
MPRAGTGGRLLVRLPAGKASDWRHRLSGVGEGLILGAGGPATPRVA